MSLPSCIICLDALKAPSCLPCGHVFCNDCIVRLVDCVKPYTNDHFCPTCRTPFSTRPVDHDFLPERLRVHLTPAIRRLYIESPPSSPSAYQTTFATAPSPPLKPSLPAPEPTFKPTSTLPASGAPALPTGTRSRTHRSHPLDPHPLHPFLAQLRSHVQASASAAAGLTMLTRMARDEAIRFRHERDELGRKYAQLKEQYDESIKRSREEGAPRASEAEGRPSKRGRLDASESVQSPPPRIRFSTHPRRVLRSDVVAPALG